MLSRRTPNPDMAPGENLRMNGPSSRRGASLQPVTHSDLDNDYDSPLSRETQSRRQDQRIKNEITNKLYQIDLDRVKPCVEVQLQTGFRKNIYGKKVPRRYLHTPRRPEEQLVLGGAWKIVKDPRRYSTAGNLDIYRAKPTATIAPRNREEEDFGFERPEPDKSKSQPSLAGYYQDYYRRSRTEPLVAVSPYNPSRPYGYGISDHGRTRSYDYHYHPLAAEDEYELRKLAELKVKGRATSNGPARTSYEPYVTSYQPYVTSYQPYVMPQARPSSTPSSSEYWRQPSSSSYRVGSASSASGRRTPLPGASNTWGRQLNESRYELGEFERLMRKTFGGERATVGGGGGGGRVTYYETYQPPQPPPPPQSVNYYHYREPYYDNVYESYPQRYPSNFEYTLYSPPTRVTRPGEYIAYNDSVPYGRSIPSSSSYYSTYWNR